jgi:hypothetical protein
LLLAAQISNTNGAPRRPYLWTVSAFVLAIFFTGGYTTWKVVTGYRDRRDALAVFGKNVRHEAEAHHWRYEVVAAKDEGLLLYLRKTHFIDPQLAITEWNNGNLDALITSAEKATTMMPKLPGAVIFESKQTQVKDYVLVARRPAESGKLGRTDTRKTLAKIAQPLQSRP